MLPATDQSDRPEAPTVTLGKTSADPADQPVSAQPPANPAADPMAPVAPVGPAPVDGAGVPPSPPKPPAARRRFGWMRRKRHPVVRILQVLALAVLVFIGIVGYSVGGYLTRPGNDSVAAREIGRAHV